MTNLKQFRYFFYSLLITIAACLCAELFSRLEPFSRLELTVSDYRFKLRGQTEVDDHLSLILVDQHTVEEYGEQFSRQYYATVAKVLADAGAKVIAFDSIFDQNKSQYGDQVLARVTSIYENIIHSWYTELDEAPVSYIFSKPRIPIPSNFSDLSVKSGLYNTAGNMHLPYHTLLHSSDFLGLISAIPDADEVIRHIPLLVKHDGWIYPSFALLTVCRALNVSPVEVKPGEYLLLRGSEKETKIPIDSKGRMLINYTGDIMSLANIRFSFYDVYESIMLNEPIVPVSVFKDKIVIIGKSDPVSSDICSIPFDNVFPGVAVHAMAVNTILRHQFLDEAPDLLNLAVLLIFASVAALIAVFFLPWLAAIFVSILIAVLWFTSYLSFSHAGMMLSFVTPATGVILSFGGTLLYGYMMEIRKAKALRDVFQKHVSPEVMQEIINQSENIINVERKKVTVLFSDLKDSVPWAEELSSEPEKLVEELNEYFSEMVDVIFQYGGTLLKFTGDGLLAVYGAPLKHPNPALSAGLTGIKMQRRLRDLNRKREAEGKRTLFMRIGINTGEAVLGDIGSEKRQQYAAMGDTVNVAQRTEGQCKPGYVAITQNTYQEIKEYVVVEPMGMRKLKGKSKPMMLYHVMSVKERSE